jgi:hypothetical protein
LQKAEVDFGNRGGRPHGSRNRAILNEEFIAALLRHFRRDGERAIARMAAAQPAAYCKILTLLVPREHKVEHSNAVSGLSDEELEAAIEHIKASLAARAGDQAKVIEGTVEPVAIETTAQAAEHEAAPRKRPNRLLEQVDTAVGPKERRPRKRKVPSPPGA